MALVRFTLGIGYANAEQWDELEVDIEGLSPEEVEEELEREWQSWAWNYIDGGSEIIKE